VTRKLSKKYSQKDYEEEQKKILKMKNKLDEIKRNNPKLTQKIDVQTDTLVKLNAMNSLIGFLVRKGHDSVLPMDVLIDIANDYEKRLSEN